MLHLSILTNSYKCVEYTITFGILWNDKKMARQQSLISHLSRSRVMRVVMLLSIIIIGLVVLFHDYPGHDHFEFLHDLIRNDNPIKQIKTVLASNVIGKQKPVRTDANVNTLADEIFLGGGAKNVTGFYPQTSGMLFTRDNTKQLDGFYYLLRNLSPPADNRKKESGISHISSDLSPPSSDIKPVKRFYPFTSVAPPSANYTEQVLFPNSLFSAHD